MPSMVIGVRHYVCSPGQPCGDSFRGKDPIGAVAAKCYFAIMNLLLIIIVLLLLFGGGGFYFGGPAIGGGGIGLILLVFLVIYLMGGWRTKK